MLAQTNLSKQQLCSLFKESKRQYAQPFTDSTEHLSTSTIPAAVLLPIVIERTELSLLFTKRKSDLKDHAGQISFPGGKVEPGDRSFEATALRETEEEIGLKAQHIQVIGNLEPTPTRTGFLIAPVIGLIAPPIQLRIDHTEVAEVFQVPLDFILNPSNHQYIKHHYANSEYNTVLIHYKNHQIWGATARIIVTLTKTLHHQHNKAYKI